MNNIKLALILAEDLKKLAGSIELFVKSTQKDENLKDQEPLKVEPITIVKVRAVLAEKSQSGKQPEVKALITKFGAKKLTDIDPACYEKLLKEASEL